MHLSRTPRAGVCRAWAQVAQITMSSCQSLEEGLGGN